MAVLKNRAKMSTSTTGTGTITLGSAESGYQTFADAGVANADVVRYVIEDTGGAFEIGTGTYTSSGTTLSRTVSESSNSNNAINLSGSATVFIGATAEDILSDVVDDTTPQLGGNLDVQTREITTSTTNGNVKLTPNGTGAVEVKGAGGNDGTLQLNCSDNSHGVKIKSPPHSAAASYTLTLPDDDGAASEFLQTDGSGNLSWAAGGGGDPDLYADSANGSAVTPTANAGGSYNSVAIGNGADIGSGRGDSIAIGTDALTNQSQALAIGKSATVNASGTWGTAVGRNSVVNGQSAVALGNSYSAGTDSFAAVIDNNSSSYGASGISSIAGGYLNKASSSDSLCWGGDSNICHNSQSAIVGGQLNDCSGGYSFITGGYNNNILAAYSRAGGKDADTGDNLGKDAYASGKFSSRGDCQTAKRILMRSTTDATATVLTAQGNAPNTTNQVILPNNSCYGFTGTVIARENSAQTNDFAVWEIKGGAVRAANAASTTLGSYNINKISESTGAANWSIALSADTTNGAVAITVTGEASHSIRWVATVNTTEVTY